MVRIGKGSRYVTAKQPEGAADAVQLRGVAVLPEFAREALL